MVQIVLYGDACQALLQSGALIEAPLQEAFDVSDGHIAQEVAHDGALCDEPVLDVHVYGDIATGQVPGANNDIARRAAIEPFGRGELGVGDGAHLGELDFGEVILRILVLA